MAAHPQPKERTTVTVTSGRTRLPRSWWRDMGRPEELGIDVDAAGIVRVGPGVDTDRSVSVVDRGQFRIPRNILHDLGDPQTLSADLIDAAPLEARFTVV